MKGHEALAAFREREEDKDFVFGHVEQQYRLFGRRLEVLDAGSGTGALTAWLTSGGLLDYVNKCTGLELVPGSAEYARTLFGENDQRKFQAGDLLDCQFPEESFDVILLLGNILGELVHGEVPKDGSACARYAADNAVAALKACHRLLRPRGLLLLSVSNADFAEEHAFQFSAGGRAVCVQNTFVVQDEKGRLVSHWFTKDEIAGYLRQTSFRATEHLRPAPRPGDSGELARKKSNWLIAARKA